MKTLMSVLATAVLCLAAPVGAAPTKAGAPFKVNSCTTCQYSLPALAGTPAGRFLAVWEGSSTNDPRGVLGRLFDATAKPQGSDLQLNGALVTPEQYEPWVAADPKGEYVTVWSSYESDDDGDIVVQRFRADGKPNGTPIAVNVDNPANPVPTDDFSPVVAKAADGGFVVVWLSLLPPSGSSPGAPPDVWARRFNAAGAPLGPQVKLSNGLVSGDRPDVCIDGLGRSVVSWTSVDHFGPFEANLRGVTVRRLNPKGGVLGAPIVVAPPLASDAASAVACAPGNLFVVVWHTDLAANGEGFDILGRRYTAAAKPRGAVFRVNSVIANDQRLPAVSVAPNGQLVAVWTSKVDREVQVVGRSFGANGAALGPDFVVDPELGDRSRPSEPEIAHLGTAGNFVVLWREGVAGLFAQRYTP
jgi:large repetitive protein